MNANQQELEQLARATNAACSSQVSSTFWKVQVSGNYTYGESRPELRPLVHD